MRGGIDMPNKKLKLAVWICNIFVAALSLLAIAAYFFMPFWSVKVAVSVKAETVQGMVGDSVDIDVSEVIGEDGIKLNVALEFKTAVLFKSFGNEEKAVTALIEDNVNGLVDQLMDTLNVLVEKVVRSAASSIVQQQVHDNIKEFLSGRNPGITDEEVTNKLNEIGLTDEFISEKTNAIIDKIYEEGATVDGLCDEIINTIDEIYAKITSSEDSDLQDSAFSDEEKEALREIVKDVMGNFAAEDGTIDADEMVAGFFLQLLESMTGGGSDESGEAGGSDESDESDEALQRRVVVTFAAEGEEADGETTEGEGAEDEEVTSARERLKTVLRDYIANLIPAEANMIVAWVMRGMTILFLFSSFWWAYILLKLFIKALRRKKPKVQNNPTVKLWTPIVFGWLPFLIFVAIPSVALKVLLRVLAGSLPETIASLAGGAGISFASAGLIAFIIAMVFFAIGIFNIVARKKFKKAAAAQSAAQGDAVESAPAYDNGGYYDNGAYPNAPYDNTAYGNQPYDNNGYYGGYENQPYANQPYDNNAYGNSGYDNNGGYDNTGYGAQSYDNSAYNSAPDGVDAPDAIYYGPSSDDTNQSN